jgi:hypothetical protein
MAEDVKSPGIEDSAVPLILRGVRNLVSQHNASLPFFDDVLEVGAPNGIIEHVLIGNLNGRPVGFACVYGAPMAAEIVHFFGVLETKAVIQTDRVISLTKSAPGNSRTYRRVRTAAGRQMYHIRG